jgi:GDP-D-mannose dehydratase
MNEIKEYNGFGIDDIVICILNNRASLTVGKEYVIRGIYANVYMIKKNQIDENFQLDVQNDDGYMQDYHNSRFMLKSKFREIIIKQIV